MDLGLAPSRLLLIDVPLDWAGTAARLAASYANGARIGRKPGRHDCALYNTEDMRQMWAVWHTRTQVCVRQIKHDGVSL